MLILGVHALEQAFEYEFKRGLWEGHDASAAILRDSELLFAIEEERLNRVKHCNRVPRRAIRKCLDYTGVTLDGVDVVAVPMTETDADLFNKIRRMSDPSYQHPDGAAMLSEVFSQDFDTDVRHKLRFCLHHLAHLWSTAIPSGFDSCLAVSLDGLGPDGNGDGESGRIAVYDGTTMQTARSLSPAQSLGFYYRSMIGLIGYSRFDEYKAMGLAPYGDPSIYKSCFDETAVLIKNGGYELLPHGHRVEIFDRIGFKNRRKGDPFTQSDKDFAAALQVKLEEIVMHLLTHHAKETRCRNLALAGGVAQNCSMNGRILRSGLFDRVFVQPAAHDAGLSVGAAIAVAVQEGVKFPRSALKHVYWGSDIGNTAEEGLKRWGSLITARKCQNIEKETARILFEGSVVAWVQGRSEFGPRALGNRSILADPRPPENKTRINSMVKKREAFRPFAPSVLAEHLRDFFVVPMSTSELPFMSMAVEVKSDKRKTLGAITHVDGTARIQTVSSSENPRYWSLINEFGLLSGVHVLLNTSFNNDAEPIVDSVDDSVACFLTTGLDYLVVGDWLVSRGTTLTSEAALGHCIATLRPACSIVVRNANDWQRSELSYAIRDDADTSETPISFALFGLLSSGAQTEIQVHFQAMRDDARSALLLELVRLWERRLILLRPKPA